MLEYHVTARRIDSHGSEASGKAARIVLNTDETDQRLDLLHRNLRKYGTISNTLTEATELVGTIRRKE